MSPNPLGELFRKPETTPERDEQRKAALKNKEAAERLERALKRLGPLNDLSEALDAKAT